MTDLFKGAINFNVYTVLFFLYFGFMVQSLGLIISVGSLPVARVHFFLLSKNEAFRQSAF